MQSVGTGFPAGAFQFGHGILLFRPADAEIADETPVGGHVKVAGQAVSNIVLRLESVADLSSGSWGTLASKSGTGSWASQPTTAASEADTGAPREAVVFEETLPAEGSGKRFYRLAAEIVP